MAYLQVLLVLTGFAALTVILKKLTISGATAGVLVAFGIYIGVGNVGLAMLGAFFISGTLATSHRKFFKESIGLEEKNKGRRTLSQVISNGVVAAVCGLLAIVFPQQALMFQLACAASLASATADTLSSELGSVYGSRFYNILTLKRDKRGLDGVVSLEGTCLGAVGSMLIAAIFAAEHHGWSVFFIIAFGGIFGNLIDSILGAGLQRKGVLNNDFVNLLNTFFSAAFACLFFNIIVP